MKKTIIVCDRCGSENIRPVTLRWLESYEAFVATDGERKYSDICTECAEKVLWLSYLRPKTAAQIWNEEREKKSVNTSNFELVTGG